MLMLLMQAYLSGPGGHLLQETLGWMAACKTRGVDLKIFCDITATPEVVRETGALPAFGEMEQDITRFCRPDQFHGGDPYCQLLSDFMVHSRSAARGCALAWSSLDTPADLVVFPFADVALMNGAAEWLADLAADERPAMVFNFIEPDYGWTVSRNPESATGDFSFFRFTARRLAALVAPGKLSLTAFDPRLSRLVSKIGGVECRPAPMLQDYAGEPDIGAERFTRGPIIGLLGGPRSEKGSDLTTDIIDAVCRAEPNVGFIVQAASDKDVLDLAERLRGRGPHMRAKLNAGPLSRDRYLGQLAACDLILLPYQAHRYAMRASGVFAEALGLGVPVVTAAETWSADRLAEGWGAGEVFDAYDANAIQAAVSRALARLPQLKSQAEAGAAVWRQTYSIDAYMDQMLASVSDGHARG